LIAAHTLLEEGRGRTIINLDDEEVRRAGYEKLIDAAQRGAGFLARSGADGGGSGIMRTLVVENCAVPPADERGSEYAVGYVVVSDGRIVQVGSGAAPVPPHDGARVVDGSGCLATPGLINSDHRMKAVAR
jgi:imidazolonepropionase-like amidohydrolase